MEKVDKILTFPNKQRDIDPMNEHTICDLEQYETHIGYKFPDPVAMGLPYLAGCRQLLKEGGKQRAMSPRDGERKELTIAKNIPAPYGIVGAGEDSFCRSITISASSVALNSLLNASLVIKAKTWLGVLAMFLSTLLLLSNQRWVYSGTETEAQRRRSFPGNNGLATLTEKHGLDREKHEACDSGFCLTWSRNVSASVKEVQEICRNPNKYLEIPSQ
ncbi:hypothetical protein NE237_005347 [Protea cynaroides]|uniref:Uncharacterized protein n=1 Tax=Protea cynaroides TaxID=273540 RepID=A0A9Q0KKE6_9MAGN|nr:hypothetical protein NE237_005347 [Protea cynaroides]